MRAAVPAVLCQGKNKTAPHPFEQDGLGVRSESVNLKGAFAALRATGGHDPVVLLRDSRRGPTFSTVLSTLWLVGRGLSVPRPRCSMRPSRGSACA